ncbi:MAG TPA: DNA gyrase inhibitor YacG [Acidisphaera sp.]|nr:DNA gyrase inhibitor YacG [Acidisphaera sp.]
MRERCPVCRRPAEPGFRPFCSRRCADVDLGRWLTEGYRVPVSEQDSAPLDREDEPG